MPRLYFCRPDNCGERAKPLLERNWRVTQYMWNSGAFTSGNGEPSEYSTVRCYSCGTSVRTKAGYVTDLHLRDKPKC